MFVAVCVAVSGIVCVVVYKWDARFQTGVSSCCDWYSSGVAWVDVVY